MPFPLGPPNPSYWTHIAWVKNPGGFSATPDAATRPYGIHFPGDDVTITFVGNTTATSYRVYDYYGNQVTSGSMTGTPHVWTLTPPSGGWQLGWYRVYFAGPSTDPVWGDSYASTCFCFTPVSTSLLDVPSAIYYPSTGFPPSDGAQDFALKAAFGMGTSRVIVGDVTHLSTGTDTLAKAVDLVTDTTYGQYGADCWTDPTSGSVDPVRPRDLWCAFPNGSSDVIFFSGGSVLCKDGTVGPNGDKVFVGVSSGTISVYYPNSSTLVETFGPFATVPAAMAAINGVSNYITVYGTVTSPPGDLAPTAIGNAYWNGIVTVVQTLFPLGVSTFEGPTNEPTLTSPYVVGLARQFAAAVHAGNAAAKAIGPTPVDITTQWNTYLSGGGAQVVDAVATHAYNNQVNGDFNLGRRTLTNWFGSLIRHSYTGPVWQTESTWAQPVVFGTFHPRRSRTQLAMFLLWEQFGVPREHNNPWYDLSHGFNSVPAWWLSGGAFPQAPMSRVLAIETWGKLHTRKFTFGELADTLFIGSIYGTPEQARVAVLMANTTMPTSTITFRVSGGASSLVAVDCWGNTSTLSVSGGLVTVPVAAEPTYVRLPQGIDLDPYTINDWPVGQMKNLCGQVSSITVGSTSAPDIGSNRFLFDYVAFVNNHANGGMVRSTNTTPDSVTVQFPSSVTTDRVLVYTSPVWQLASTLVTFTVQTSVDGGTNWTTRATVDKSATTTSVVHGSAQTDTACTDETWFDDQNIFDVPLGGNFACNAVRVSVTATTYGGEPTAAAAAANADWGASDSTQHIVISNIAVIDANHSIPARRGRSFNGSSDYMVFGPSANIAPLASTMTVGAWMKTPSFPGGQTIITGNGSDGWTLNITATPAISFHKLVGGTSFNINSSGISLPANTWMYLAAVVGPTTTRLIRVFENGTFAGSTQADSHSFVGGGLISVGGTSSGTSLLNGLVSDPTVWYDQILTDSQVVYAAMNGGATVGNPTFYAPLDGEPVERDLSYYYQTGRPVGTTLVSDKPSVSQARCRVVGATMIGVKV